MLLEDTPTQLIAMCTTSMQDIVILSLDSCAVLQLRYKEPGQKIYWPNSKISPDTAEMRADMGNAADFWQMQVFDGPGPETINSRLAMVGSTGSTAADCL